MIEVVVVIIHEIKKIFYLYPNNIELKKGDIVVFESQDNSFVGEVIRPPYLEKIENIDMSLEKVIRIINDKDRKNIENNKKIMNKSLVDAKKYSKELGLKMNFIDSYLNLDGSQLILSFIAEDRVDFRELVKKLAQKYKTRIELRQIGVRDKAKKVGGLGPCGMFLCCNSFLTDFNSVSINMAKNQMLALNPSKINGICGRLLCCLAYENDTYTVLKKKLPKIGEIFSSEDGTGKIVNLDIFNNTFSVDLGEKGIVKYSGDIYHGKNK